MPQTLRLETAALPAQPTGTLVVYVTEGNPPSGAAAGLWAGTGLDWQAVSTGARFTGRQGQLIELPAPPGIAADRLLMLGAGRPAETAPTLAVFTDRGGSLLAKLGRVEKVAIILDGPEMTPLAIAELAAGIRLRHYRFDRYKSPRKEDEGEPAELAITLHVTDKPAADTAIADRMATVEGVLLARTLVNEPPNVLGPVEFADELEKLREFGLVAIAGRLRQPPPRPARLAAGL